MKWIKAYREFGNRDYVDEDGVVEYVERYEAYSYNGNHGLYRKVEWQQTQSEGRQFSCVEETWRDGNRSYVRTRGEKVYDILLCRAPGTFLCRQVQRENKELSDKVLSGNWKEL